MNPNEYTMKFRQFHAQIGGPTPGPLARILNALLSVVLLVVGFFFSLVAFAVAAVVGTLGAAWLWWKTRAMRRQIEEQLAQQPAFQANETAFDGHIIEGEAVREPEPGAPAGRLLN